MDKDITLYPKFEKTVVEQKYTVTFISNEGGNVQGSNVRTYTAGQSAVATAHANDGYEFIGWSTEKDGPIISTYINYSYVVNSDMTIYLNFKKIPEYTVDLVKTTGCSSVEISTASGASSITVREDTTIDIFAYGESGYTFKGWYDNASFNGSPISTSSHYTFQVKSNLTLYPKFENTVSTDSNILVKGVSNSISDWTNANGGSYLNITSGSSDYLYNGAKTLKLDYNINTYDQYGGYAGRTVSLESTYKNDSSKGYNGIGFWYMTPADFNGQIALCLQSQSAGLDDLVQLPATNGEWKYYFDQTDKTNLSDLTLYINGSKNGYTTTASNGVAKGTLYMADIKLDKK